MRILPLLCVILHLALSTWQVNAQSSGLTPVVLPETLLAPLQIRDDAVQWRAPRYAAAFKDARLAWRQGAFIDPSGQEQTRSMTVDAIWYRIGIANPTTTNFRFHVALGSYYLVFGEVVLERAGNWETVLTESNAQPFWQRDIQTPQLVSQAFDIPQNSETVLWIGMAADGSSDIGISLLTPQDLAVSHLRSSNFQTAYYVSIALIGMSMLCFLFVYFSWAQFLYFAFFVILAAYNAQLSGVMFQWVWPNAPCWNGYASHYIGMSGVMCAAWATYLFVSADQARPVFRWASIMFQVIGLLAMLAPFVLPLVTIKSLLGLAVLFFLILQFWGAFIAIRHRVDGNFFVAAASCILIVYLGVFTVGSQFDGLIPAFWVALALHVGPLLDGVLRFFSTVLQSYKLKQDQVDGQRRLSHLQETLQAVRHDIRQPLGTMRTFLDRLEREKDQGEVSEKISVLKESLDYLEGVIEETSPPQTHQLSALDTAKDIELAPVELYLTCMARMFSQEASAKGIDLRVIRSSALVLAPPLTLTRIMANLVHNSILHSRGTKIVIGVRRAGGGKVSVQILDNGIGYTLPNRIIAGTDRARAKHGNGLRIAMDLAKSSNVKVTQISHPHRLTLTKLGLDTESGLSD